MRVYGWEHGTAPRGELLAANADKWIATEYPQALQGELGWEALFTSFRQARRALADAMADEHVNAELIATVLAMRQRDTPVVNQ